MANTQQYIVEILGKDKTSQAFKQVTGNVDKAKQSVLTLKNAIIALGTGAVVRSIINTTARFQDLRTALSSVTGSAEAGAEAFGFISKFATKTQFGVGDLTETFIKLKSAGITPTEKLLTTFTDTAAVTTDQLGSLQAITDLFARSISGGLGLEDLNRLADRGVPVFKILQEQLGLTRLEVSEFGKTAEGASKVRQALVAGLDKSFGGATAERVKNLSTQMSNLGIAFTKGQDVLGQGFNVQLGNALDGITNFIVENEKLIRSVGEGLGTALGVASDGFKNVYENAELLRNTFILLIALKVGLNITKITTATEGLTKAFGLLNTVVKRNPFLVVGGIAVTAVALFGEELKKLNETTDKATEIQDKYNKILQETVTETNNVKKAVRELNKGTAEALDLSQQIIEKNNEAKILQIQNVELQNKIDGLNKKIIKGNNSLVESIQSKIDANNKIIQVIDEEIAKLIELSEQVDINTDNTDDNTDSLKKNIDKQKESLDLIKQTLDARKQFEEETMAKIRQFDPARAEIEAEANKQTELEKLRNQGYISEQKYKVLSEDLTKQSNARLYELFKQGKLDELDFARISEETKQSIFLNSARDILGALSQTNKKAFEIYKAFAISDAIVSTYQGVAKALAKGFPLGYIEAGITLAKGFAQVSAIRSQSFQGRALGGRVQEGKQYMVGEQGAEMFVPDQSGTIVANKNLGGATNVNITINANDTEGFDDLLIKRRSTIINVINDALNSQGREAII
jgi:hypothetical protein